MGQNISQAVMARRAEPRDSLERWRPIAGWPGYEVSDHGRVRSWKWPGAGRQWREDRTRGARMLRQDSSSGYRSVLLCDVSRGKKHALVHALVLGAFVGPRPEGWHGAHGNGVGSDNRLANLRWASAAENNADKRAHGSHRAGERIGSAKLRDAQVREIVRLRAAGERVVDLATRFGVCRNTISSITGGHSWREVTRGAE